MSDLLPCPFCGSSNIESGNMMCGYDWFVQCVVCLATVEDYPSLHEAENAWNRRASKWISVEERLPKYGTTVELGHWFTAKGEESRWLWIASGSVERDDISFSGRLEWWCDWADDFFLPEYHKKVTHWRHLPPKPTPEAE